MTLLDLVIGTAGAAALASPLPAPHIGWRSTRSSLSA
jgi:hypothetical protein